jgi:lipopolysaccharide assembly protein B
VAELWVAVALASLAGIVGVLVADRLKRRRDEAEAYLKGVRSIVSGDPDAAIEALSDAARLGSPQAVETYLALGALFRREGDLARAIRLHRNMLLGPYLDPARRPEVERELAVDYRRSGMLDEAAELYERLARVDPSALDGLRDVRFDQGDLPAAIALQRRIGAGANDAVLAHLLAAHARAALPGDAAAAVARAREALDAHPASADALLALAEAEAAAGHAEAALSAVGGALDADPRVAPLAWPALAALADPARAVAAMAARLGAAPGEAGLHLLHARALQRAGRVAEATTAARRALEADRVGEVTLAMREALRAADAPGPEDLPLRHDLLVEALLKRARAPRCGRCGAEAAVRDWRCRRCGAFDAYP